MENKSRVYTVSEITRNIKSSLEDRFPELWIEGEISNLSRVASSGHTYFTLKDASSQINAVLFKFQRLSLPSAVELKDGLSVFAFGKITVYEQGGRYQIIITRLEPKGLGALQLAFEELKNRLYKEGLFDDSRKRPLPVFPKTIGVITSPTGAAIRDIINILERRFPNIHILLYPVRVQGEGAAAEIADAIDTMNELSDSSSSKIDVLIVGRGGGSLEDLWAFNEEVTARSIARSRIPIISAVGHEIDYTISDFAADVRAPTPSAAAEMVIAQKTEFADKINFLARSLDNAIDSFLAETKARLDRLAGSYVFKEPRNALRQYMQQVDDLTHRIKQKTEHLAEIQGHKLQSMSSKLAALNPTAILERGYSITSDCKTKKIITDPSNLQPGDELDTRLARGRVISVVK